MSGQKQKKYKRTVEAEALHIVDERGRVRIRLCVEAGEPSMTLLDKEGVTRISAGIPEIAGIRRTRFTMFNEKGQEAIMLEASSPFSQMQLHNARGQSEVGLFASWDGAIALMRTKNGAADVFIDKNGPAADLRDSKAKTVWRVPAPTPQKVGKKRASRG